MIFKCPVVSHQKYRLRIDLKNTRVAKIEPEILVKNSTKTWIGKVTCTNVESQL